MQSPSQRLVASTKGLQNTWSTKVNIYEQSALLQFHAMHITEQALAVHSEVSLYTEATLDSQEISININTLYCNEFQND